MWLRLMYRSFSSTSREGNCLKGVSLKAKSIGGLFTEANNNGPTVINKDGVNSPLVILVGWAMAKQRHVNKYSAVYNKLGCPTLSFTPSILHSWDVISHSKYTTNIMHFLNTNYSGPILFHLFSGASFIVLPHYTQNVHTYNNITLKGIVFDCGPVSSGYDSGEAAANISLQQGVLNRYTYYMAMIAGTIMDKLKGAKIRQRLDDAMIMPTVLSVPQLYLYCMNDPVMPVSRVKDIMRQQREECGRDDIEGIAFDGGNHVRLLQSDGIKYNNCIQSFLERIY